ncbi:hypothetical protein H0H92_010515 [Tricholoma furcatifolium]|nr:hypothetical protein H0H92_010515 [Tricholoma furcatifolium]
MAQQRKSPQSKDVDREPSSTTEISEEEQWRLVNDSGILSKLKTQPIAEEEEDAPLAEEIFNATVFIIPMSFLLLLMEILIHFQYGKHPTLKDLVDRMVPGVPISVPGFAPYSGPLYPHPAMRYKSQRSMQFFLFVLGALSGSRMIYLLNRGPWLVNMKQCPPLATAWVYSVVQLELMPAVINLFVVGIYVWWQGLSLRP